MTDLKGRLETKLPFVILISHIETNLYYVKKRISFFLLTIKSSYVTISRFEKT